VFAQTIDHKAPLGGSMPTHDLMPTHMRGAMGSLPMKPGQDAFGAVRVAAR
jgi:hypothetical protein